MRRHCLAGVILLALAMSTPALACDVPQTYDFEDTLRADTVVVGRISDYRIVRNEAHRQKMRRNPKMPADARIRSEALSDYARFEIHVDEVLLGSPPTRLFATMDNLVASEPQRMADGTFVIALMNPAATTSRNSTTATRNGEGPEPYTVLQSPCVGVFMFENTSKEAQAARRILAARRP
jgi:hypothetical protein